jgi:DNA-binding MarR family transcriptional regulator
LSPIAEEESLEQALTFLAEETVKFSLCPRKALKRLAELSTHSEKLVFLFLCISQPQTFTGIRRTLKMDKATLSRTLKKLHHRGLITIGTDFLYWINFKALDS